MNGEVLKSLRLEKGLTQAQLGKLVGVAGSTIRMVETNNRNGSLELCSKLADYFNVSIDYLENRTEYKNASDAALGIIEELKLKKLIEVTDDVTAEMLNSIFTLINKTTH